MLELYSEYINSHSEMIINDLKQLLKYSDVFGSEVNSIRRLVKHQMFENLI